MKKAACYSFHKVFLFLLLSVGLVWIGRSDAVQEQIRKAKIFEDENPMISDGDFHCSIGVLDGEIPELKIIASPRQEEKMLLGDDDTFFINKGRADGLEVGQVFLVLEVGSPVNGFGPLYRKKGKVRVDRLEEGLGVCRVDKACGQIEIGNYLVPFEIKENVIGKDTGFGTFQEENEGAAGRIIYLEGDLHIIGSGHWAIIDMGEDKGIKIGQQMNIYRRVKKDLPREAVGNLLVIDTQRRTSTVKILSCRDTVEIGYQVQTK